MRSVFNRSAVLVGALAALAGAELLAPAASAAATTVSSNYGSLIYFDSKSSSPALKGSYIGYTITNTSVTADSDVWVTIGNFAGGSVTLAPNAASTVHVGALAAGDSHTVFFYVQASSATTTPQTHTITVYNGEPGAGGVSLTSASESLTVSDTIAASSNQVNSVSVSTNSPALGGSFSVTVNGCTGTIGSPPVLYFTPAADVTWPANVFELTGTQVKFNPSDPSCSNPSPTNSGTFTNELVVPQASVPDSHDTSYTATYTFEATRTITSSTSVSPIGYIESGTQVKHTSTGNFAQLAPIKPVSNALTLGLAPSRSLVDASSRTVTLTATATNSGSAATRLDDFVATLPSGAGYVSGSSTYNGAAIADPSISGQTASWAGVFGVGANGTSTLSFQVTLPSTSGSYTTSMIGHVASAQVDSTLDTSDSAPATAAVSVDAIAPTVSLTSTPAADTASTAGSFDFSSSEASSYQCQLDSGAWSACASSASLTGSDTISGLANGPHTFSVEATDAAGNVSAPASYTWTVDTSLPPDAPAVTAPADGAYIGQNEPAVRLSADAGAQVTVYVDGTSVGTAAADGSGGASLTLTSPLADGRHTVYATASNGGAPSAPSATNTFTVDTTAPAAPVITAPADGSTLTSTTPTIALTAEPGSTDTVYVDGTSVGTATADNSAHATLALSSALSLGGHTVTATATDAAGNTSPPSTANGFTIALPPAAPAILTPADGSRTNRNEPTVTLTAATGSRDAIYIDGVGVGTATADGTGHATLTLTSPLSDGPHTVYATAANGAGTSPSSAANHFTVDTAAPAAPVVTAPVDGSTITSTTPTISITAEPDSTDTIYIDGSSVGTTTADSGGHASLVLTAPLTLGAHTATATATDAAGNTSPSSLAAGFTIAAAPTAPTAPAAPTVLSPADGSLTRENRPTITLTADAGTLEAIYVDGTNVGTATADGTGHATLALSTPLSDGAHTVYATAANGGGTSPQSATNTFTVDTTAPSVAITSAPDASTADTTAGFAFTSGDQAASFQCQLDGGPWSTCASPASYDGLGVGSHTFNVRALDPAGNLGATVSYTWAIAAPAPAPAPPTPPALTSTGVGTAVQGQQLTIPPGGSVILLDAGGNAATTVTVSGQGTYVLNPSTGAVSFAPALGWRGAASPVSYRVTDALGQTATASYTPTVTPPGAPTATSVVSTAGGGVMQTQTITVPDGGSVALLDHGVVTNRIVVPHEGTYTLDPSTGKITFAPISRFVGHAKAVSFRVIDAYGQASDATYAATVTAAAPAPVGRPGVHVALLAVVASGTAGSVPVRCGLRPGTMTGCAVALLARVGGRDAVIGRGSTSVRAPRHRLTVVVSLNELGRALSQRLGGTHFRAVARVAVAGQVLPASALGRIVAGLVTLPHALLFNTDDASLRPTAGRYLAKLKPRLTGAGSITVIGYGDSSAGDDDDDFELGARRAAAVAFDLRHLGVRLAISTRTGAVAIPGDLDRPQPVVGARILVRYG